MNSLRRDKYKDKHRLSSCHIPIHFWLKQNIDQPLFQHQMRMHLTYFLHHVQTPERNTYNLLTTAILKWTFCICISTSRTQMSLLSVSTIHCINWSILNFNVHFKVISHVQVIMILIETIKFIISCRHDDELLVDWLKVLSTDMD